MILSSTTLPRALRVASSNCDTKTSPRKTSNGKKACQGRHDCSSSSLPSLYSQNCCYVCRLFAICFVFLSSIVILETATVAAYLRDGRHRQVPIEFGSTNLRHQREIDAANLANDIGGQAQPQHHVTHGNYNTGKQQHDNQSQTSHLTRKKERSEADKLTSHVFTFPLVPTFTSCASGKIKFTNNDNKCSWRNIASGKATCLCQRRTTFTSPTIQTSR